MRERERGGGIANANGLEISIRVTVILLFIRGDQTKVVLFIHRLNFAWDSHQSFIGITERNKRYSRNGSFFGMLEFIIYNE